MQDLIEKGQATLGIELGSTRIKSVLIDDRANILAQGVYTWENSFINGIWTYDLNLIHTGLRECYKDLKDNVKKSYGITLKRVKTIGISAMMHGYIALDKDKNLLSPFQTWRNTNTQDASDTLTELFNFNIPLRWSIAHLYQRILDKETHIKNIDYVCTLSAYVHYLLSNKKVLGIGDASGMFPIDESTHNYDSTMLFKFNNILKEHDLHFKLEDIFPQVLCAGDEAGYLTKEGALILDASGDLQDGIALCPPEGDAGTGMVATNAIAPRTGNISAGTSLFAMIVLEHKLSKYYREIDMVCTPDGSPCAMSHANNGTTDLNAWINLFSEFSKLFNLDLDDNEIYTKLYTKSLEGDLDCGGLMPYNYYSGENITMLNEGRPIFLRSVKSNFNLANFMRSHLFSSLTAVSLGLDLLFDKEQIKLDKITGHGGLFKTKKVGQAYMSAAVKAPVTVMDTASEGGAFGIALLALFKDYKDKYKDLASFLNDFIFKNMQGSTYSANNDEIKGFEIFKQNYVKALDVEREAINCIKW